MSTSPSSAEPFRVPRRAIVWLAALVAMALLPTCLVFVDETEFVIVQRFGRIVAVYDRAEDKGAHLKWPWPMDQVFRFDRRVTVSLPPGRELFTRDRKNLIVEAFIGWKIPEPSSDEISDFAQRPVVKFYRSLGRADVAESRLSSRLQAILTSRFGQTELSELISAPDSDTAPSTDSPLDRLSAALKQDLMQRADEAASLRDQMGIEIVDVRIKRLNLPSGNLQAVYERMRSERQKIAERYRSAGLAESRVIRSRAERQAAELLAQANAEAERIKAGGEADVLRILNEAHAEDPEFYELLQALDAYKQLLGEQTTLVLSASNSLWKLLTDGPPRGPDQTSPPATSAEKSP